MGDEPDDKQQTLDEAADGEEESEPKPTGPEAKLQRALTDFKDDLQRRARPIVRAKKALEQLCRTGGMEDLERVQKYAGRLEDSNLEALDMEERRQKAVDSLDSFARKRKRKRRMQFMQKLHQRADERGVDFEKRSETPLTMYAAPLTLEANFEAGRVTLSYARCELTTTDLDPDAVFEAYDAAVDELEERTIDSEAFFGRLRDAYRLAVRNRGEAEGERVDLVDLLAPLALMSSSADGWRDSSFDAISPYPRYLLSRQLARLRGDGMLTDGDLRIDLGTATGGSTENKEDVVFIPSGKDDGQYYLSIRFTADA
jgi:hypothetical protein